MVLYRETNARRFKGRGARLPSPEQPQRVLRFGAFANKNPIIPIVKRNTALSWF